jgi:hypothetical protein
MLSVLMPIAYSSNLTTHIQLTADQISCLTYSDYPAPAQYVVMMYVHDYRGRRGSYQACLSVLLGYFCQPESLSPLPDTSRRARGMMEVVI